MYLKHSTASCSCISPMCSQGLCMMSAWQAAEQGTCNSHLVTLSAANTASHYTTTPRDARRDGDTRAKATSYLPRWHSRAAHPAPARSCTSTPSGATQSNDSDFCCNSGNRPFSLTLPSARRHRRIRFGGWGRHAWCRQLRSITRGRRGTLLRASSFERTRSRGARALVRALSLPV